MIDFYLKATNETTLAAALPWLRDVVEGEDGGEPVSVWLEASENHALIPNVVIVTTPAVVDADGAIVSDAVLASGFFANLRLLEGHPAYGEIVAACAQFAREVQTPRQQFAASEPEPTPVPVIISDRQFAQVLAIDGVITEAEALAWAARGDLPAALEAAVDELPEAQRFGARMLLAAATTYERAHPLLTVLGAILGRDAAALDDIWRRAGAV